MQDNFHYTNEHIVLLQDEAIIYQKNQLLEKIENQMLQMAQDCNDAYPHIKKISPPPKVSKGEKHQGLPFIVLDYPRQFKKSDTFAIRFLVWWGKQISITLQLKGRYLSENIDTINAVLSEKNEENEYYIQLDGDEWVHELKESYKNYDLPIPSTAQFLKISCCLPLSQLNDLKLFYQNKFHRILALTKYGNL